MSFFIGKKEIGGSNVFIIAELSANHNQNINTALQLIELAYKAGADAIKLQTYTPDTLTLNIDSPLFTKGEDSIWAGRTLYNLYQEAYTPWEWQPKLKRIANDLGMDLFSSPFDHTAVNFLEDMGVPAYKIASFEIVDIPLIQKVARTGKPIILSTGMATLSEIEEAVNAAREAGCEQLALLKCTSSYPASPDDMNLRTIPHMAEAFKVPVGLSDHTLGIAVPVTAVALGACIIEKHFTLSRSVPGPDSAFSLEPDEFKAMVGAIRTAERALGNINYHPSENEKGSRLNRRSLFITNDVKKGELFTAENVRSIRPGQGLHTRYLKDVLGRQAAKDILRGTPLVWGLIF